MHGYNFLPSYEEIPQNSYPPSYKQKPNMNNRQAQRNHAATAKQTIHALSIGAVTSGLIGCFASPVFEINCLRLENKKPGDMGLVQLYQLWNIPFTGEIFILFSLVTSCLRSLIAITGVSAGVSAGPLKDVGELISKKVLFIILITTIICTFIDKVNLELSVLPSLKDLLTNQEMQEMEMDTLDE